MGGRKVQTPRYKNSGVISRARSIRGRSLYSHSGKDGGDTSVYGCGLYGHLGILCLRFGPDKQRDSDKKLSTSRPIFISCIYLQSLRIRSRQAHSKLVEKLS